MLIAATSFSAMPPTGSVDAQVKATPPSVAPTAPGSSKTNQAVAELATLKEVKAAVAALNKRLEPMDTSVRFELDDSTGKTVITMLDTENNSVLRQFPSKETLAMIRAIDQQQGLLINTTS